MRTQAERRPLNLFARDRGWCSYIAGVAALFDQSPSVMTGI